MNSFARLLLLAALLVFGQVGTLTHAVEHIGNDEQSGVPHAACEICVGYAHMAAAAVGKAALPIALHAAPVPLTPQVADFIPRRPAPAYHVRAPPVLS